LGGEGEKVKANSSVRTKMKQSKKNEGEGARNAKTSANKKTYKAHTNPKRIKRGKNATSKEMQSGYSSPDLA